MEESKSRPELSTGRRIWIVTAMVISIIVLVLNVAGIAGTWVARGVVIDIGIATFETIDQVAGIGREGAAAVDDVVAEIRTVTGEVVAAVDEIASDVSNKGIVLTLLPPEKEQRLYDAADRVGETVDSILSVIEAVTGLLEAIDSIPFINLPKPDPAEVEEMQANVQALADDVEQLASDIQQFRDEAAGEISRISSAAEEVGGRLDNTRANLSEIDSSLADIQERANAIKQRFSTIVTVIAVILTLLLAWVAYGMVALTRNYWAELRAPSQPPALPSKTTPADEPSAPLIGEQPGKAEDQMTAGAAEVPDDEGQANAGTEDTADSETDAQAPAEANEPPDAAPDEPESAGTGE